MRERRPRQTGSMRTGVPRVVGEHEQLRSPTLLVDAAVAEFTAAAEGRHRDVIVTALQRLQKRFGSDEQSEGRCKDGPTATALFEMGADPETAEERALRQREVADLLGRFLDALAPLWK